jgi:flagellin
MRIGEIFVSAMRMNANLARQSAMMDRAIERISTGQRINHAADDPAGLAIREKMRGQVRGMRQAQKNAQDGISLLQTAEGNLAETESILHRMRELAAQAANGTLGPNERLAIQKEIDQLVKEIDRIAGSTAFNTRPLLRGRIALSGETLSGGREGEAAFGMISLWGAVEPGDTVTVGGVIYTFGDGSGDTVAIGQGTSETAKNLAAAINRRDGARVKAESSYESIRLQAATPGAAGNAITLSQSTVDDGLTITLQVGANAGQTMDIVLHNMDSGSLGIGLGNDGKACVPGENAAKGIDMTTPEAAQHALDVIDRAIDSVSSERGSMGAYSNRLDYTIQGLETAAENLSAAESRISDADIAEEMAAYMKAQLLTEVTTALMARSIKMRTDSILKLLEG